jgi:AcrR family transcriptional regulator
MTERASAGGTPEAIMQATYRALTTHGYAETSISRIAAEFDKSKSVLYYHYDGKEDLLADFLEFLLARFEADVDAVLDGDPHDDLRRLLDELLPAGMDDEDLRLNRAVLEMRTQTPYHDAYLRQFEETDRRVLDEIESILERGIEDGSFADVDAADLSESVLDTTYGARERAVTLDDPSIVHRARDRLERSLERELFVGPSQ